MSKRKVKKSKPKYIGIMWCVFGGLWLMVALLFVLLSLGWIGNMPSFEELENPRIKQASEVLADDGIVLGFIGEENRSDVSYDQISPNLMNALIATEDVRFYSHSGIDFRSLGRVLFKTVIGRHSASGGGSTITQQLAKNLFPRQSHNIFGTIFAKIKEWVVAVKLEHKYSKQEILTMYFNMVDFGSNAKGVKTASKTFFDKLPSDLTIDEAAVLVGLLKAPTSYSPVLHPDRCMTRRNTVLSQMKRYGYLDEEEFEKYSAAKIDMSHFSPQSHNEGLATYLREYVRTYMKDWCKNHRKPNGEYYDVYKDGLKIHTTINSRMQLYAEQAVKEHFSKEIQPKFDRELKNRKGNPFCDIDKAEQNKILEQAMRNSDRYRNLKKAGLGKKEIREKFNEKVNMRVFTWKGNRDTVMSPWDSLIYYKRFLNVGMMSVEPGTGYVRAYVGGINYRYFKFDNVQSTRQVGSTFKPFVYTMALQDLGMYPCTEVPNAEVCFPIWGSDDWCPKNSSHDKEGEMVTLKWALANSINWVSAYLMQQGSPEQVIDIARKMGVRSKIDAVPSICVGAAEITVYEMAAAMATFANKGEYVEPIIISYIEDKKGMVLDRITPERNEAISEVTAYMMLELMKGVVQSGTGVRLNYKYNLNNYTTNIAGKTGTTQNNSDGWFVGITPRLATAVWTGGEVRSIHFQSMANGQGAAMALPVFGLFMQKVYQDKNLRFYRGDFERPAVPINMDCTKFQEEIQSEENDWDF